MVNWLYLYNLFIQSDLQFASHLPIHTHTHTNGSRLTCTVLAYTFGAEGHFDMLTGGAGDGTANPSTSEQLTLPAEPQPPC